MFELVAPLAAKDFIIDMKLCRVLFENNSDYPWIFLVPRKENVKNMLTLTMEERFQLMREIALCEEVMSELFKPEQINVAILGNKTEQLNVQIVARFKDDTAWPDTVWGRKGKAYLPEKQKSMINSIKRTIMIKMTDRRFCQH